MSCRPAGSHVPSEASPAGLFCLFLFILFSGFGFALKTQANRNSFGMHCSHYRSGIKCGHVVERLVRAGEGIPRAS